MNFVCRPTYVNLAHFVFVLTSLRVFVTTVRLILFKKFYFILILITRYFPGTSCPHTCSTLSMTDLVPYPYAFQVRAAEIFNTFLEGVRFHSRRDIG